MGGFRQVARAVLETALPRSRFLVRGPRARRSVALTFDDGPHPEHTPRLLDLLAAHRLRATFFVIGREAERYPALLRRMVAEGHTLGHHTWTHGEPAATSAEALLAELTRSDVLFLETVGFVPSLMRPPKGQLTLGKLAKLLADGRRVVLWSVDPKDYALTSSAELVTWAEGAAFGAGDVILLHDVHPHCVAALPALAARLAAHRLATDGLDAWFPPPAGRS